MVMTADDILLHPALERCVRVQAQSLLSVHEASPRMASLFATQQRWLLAHAAVAQYFRNEAEEAGAGLLVERFLEIVERHQPGEPQHRVGVSQGDAEVRDRPFRRQQRGPSPPAAGARAGGGDGAVPLARAASCDARRIRWRRQGGGASARPALLGAIQPLIADGLIGSATFAIRPETFSLFTWVDEGGIVMDRLIVGCEQGADGLERIPTDVTSVSALARRLELSRTQLGRKFAEAEAMGSLGWSGPRGRSPLWVSADFRREYHAAQAVKLAIIDAAFEACAAQGLHTAVCPALA